MEQVVAKNEKNDKYVEIKVVTWNKDSHGLFDYESRNIKVNKYIIKEPSNLLKKEDQFEMLDNKKAFELEDQKKNFLTSIQCNESKQSTVEVSSQKFMESPQIYYNKDNMAIENYLIVRSIKDKEGQQKGYPLQVGDIVKLGRIEYLVQEINDGQNTDRMVGGSQGDYNFVYEVSDKDIIANKTTIKNENDEEQTQKLCRICYFEDSSDDNFLIAPCACKGSCEFVHFQCLKTWVQSKIKTKESGSTTSYNYKISDCEICNEPLPKKIKNKERTFDLIDINRPNSPYLLLELLNKDKKVNKNIHLIKGSTDENEQTLMGRGHECQVRISDISVSRRHAFIKFKNGKFVITDNTSKFGTLIKMKGPIPISEDKVAIQVGRTVITYVVRSEYQQQLQKQQQYQQQQKQLQQQQQQQQQQQNSQNNQNGNSKEQ